MWQYDEQSSKAQLGATYKVTPIVFSQDGLNDISFP